MRVIYWVFIFIDRGYYLKESIDDFEKINFGYGRERLFVLYRIFVFKDYLVSYFIFLIVVVNRGLMLC